MTIYVNIYIATYITIRPEQNYRGYPKDLFLGITAVPLNPSIP